jgi:hypothetical protein
MDRLRADLDELCSIDVTGIPDDQVREEILSLVASLNRVTAALTERVGSFDVRRLCENDAVRTTRHWLQLYGHLSQGAATGMLARARVLRRLPAVAAAFRAGRISAEHVAKIAELAEHVGVERLRDFDEILAELATQAGPAEIAKACQRIHAYLDPDGPEPDPDDELRRRELTFSRSGSMLLVRGKFDPEGGAALMAAVEAMTKPPTPGDERSGAQRRADAAVDLARAALASDILPSVNGARPHLGLLVSPAMLLAATAAAAVATTATAAEPNAASPTTASANAASPAGTGMTSSTRDYQDDPLTKAGVPPLPDRPWLTWIGEVTPELAQRLACDSIVWRTILDPATGLPLDVGRKHRIVPPWIRRALHARDRTCRWPGCETPADWTDAHHEIPWYAGGTTTIDRLVSLCRYHHGLVHEGRWRLRHDHTTGEVHITRPDGTPYEFGPSLPWTTPSRRGRQPGPPASAPHTGDPPQANWPQASQSPQGSPSRASGPPGRSDPSWPEAA